MKRDQAGGVAGGVAPVIDGARNDSAAVPVIGGVRNDSAAVAAPVIGLTGGIGTGKSTAAEYLLEAGLPDAPARGLVHVDADAISRQLTVKEPGAANPVLEEIGKAFGGAGDNTRPVLREDGSLDRGAMAALVFSDPDKKKLLEDILFRHIIAEIHRQIEAAGEAGSPVLLDAPLLFESGLDSLCDSVIVVTADEDVRIERVMARDGCSEDEVRARIRNQMPDEDKRARADYVVDNSGSLEELQRRLDGVLQAIGAAR
ncbi:MAG: dephospho-CoA kinase [Firmicutes bacterium]|nr:dephospho-CoA kinase [Bacillota bacterium]